MKSRKRLAYLLKNPTFWTITFVGNAVVFGGALIFYWLETESNPAVRSYLDSLTWAVGMVSTVGGNIAPVTAVGKMFSVLMMMCGAIYLWTYMGFIVGIVVDPELASIQREIFEIQSEVHDDEKTLNRHRKLLAALEKSIERRKAFKTSSHDSTKS